MRTALLAASLVLVAAVAVSAQYGPGKGRCKYALASSVYRAMSVCIGLVDRPWQASITQLVILYALCVCVCVHV